MCCQKWFKRSGVFDGEGEGIVDVQNCEAGEGHTKAADETAGKAARASRRTRVSRVLAVLALQLAHAQLHVVGSGAPFIAPERFCARNLRKKENHKASQQGASRARTYGLRREIRS